jgi:hypothetical protein
MRLGLRLCPGSLRSLYDRINLKQCGIVEDQVAELVPVIGSTHTAV